MDQKTDSTGKLIFKPLSEGLGFQPFSDGLPYENSTNVTRTAAPSATLSSAPPLQAVPQQSIATEKQTLGEVSKKAQKPAAQQKARTMDQPDPGSGVFWIARFLGASLDAFISLILVLSSVIVVSANTDFDLLAILSEDASGVSQGIFFLSCYALVVVQDVFLGTSLGKRFFRLELTGGTQKVFFRSLLLPFLWIATPLSFLWSVGTRKRSLLWDSIAGVTVTWMPR
jgi:hypothetical protein